MPAVRSLLDMMTRMMYSENLFLHKICMVTTPGDTDGEELGKTSFVDEADDGHTHMHACTHTLPIVIIEEEFVNLREGGKMLEELEREREGLK